MLFLNEIHQKKLKYITKKESKRQNEKAEEEKKNTINGWLTFRVTRIGFHKETLSF